MVRFPKAGFFDQALFQQLPRDMRQRSGVESDSASQLSSRDGARFVDGAEDDRVPDLSDEELTISYLVHYYLGESYPRAFLS